MLVRRFSILSHAAILAREFNIPSAVGVSSDRLKEGIKVELNASKNGFATIRILEQ